MESAITVREATSQDVETIVRFNMALAEETEDIRLDEETLRQGVCALLEDPSKGRYYLASRNGEVIGQLMTTFEWSDWRNAMFLWIQSVYVDKAHRRKGVFAALYRRVEREASRPGMCGLRLYVYGKNTAAQDTYRRLGMTAPGYSLLETPDPLKREA